jgi:hypothetical protein
MINFEEVKKQAIEELEEEQYRKAVDAYKEKLRAKKWWHYLLPFRVVFVRREV